LKINGKLARNYLSKWHVKLAGMKRQIKPGDQLQSVANTQESSPVRLRLGRPPKIRTGLETVQDVQAELSANPTQSQQYPQLSPARRSVIVDGLGVLPLESILQAIPDDVIKSEYHKRTRVGRKHGDPNYYCGYCATVFYASEYKRHSKTECKAMAKMTQRSVANLPHEQQGSVSNLTHPYSFYTSRHKSVRWIGRSLHLPMTQRTAGFRAHWQANALRQLEP
jgi:hypothetical protein